jgi:hypothetical protein
VWVATCSWQIKLCPLTLLHIKVLSLSVKGRGSLGDPGASAAHDGRGFLLARCRDQLANGTAPMADEWHQRIKCV